MRKIIVFLIVFISLLAFLSYRNSPKPVSPVLTITPTPSETPWQTYYNQKYGFEFKYPSDWRLVDISDYSPTVAPAMAKQIFITLKGDPNKPYENRNQQLSVNVIDNPKGLSIKKYFIDQKWSQIYLNNMEDISINNLESVKSKYPFNDNSSIYYINIGKHIINFNFYFSEGSDKFVTPPQQTFNQILSTFNTANIPPGWSQFETNGYSILLPPYWTTYNPDKDNSTLFSEGGRPWLGSDFSITYFPNASDYYKPEVNLWDFLNKNAKSSTVKKIKVANFDGYSACLPSHIDGVCAVRYVLPVNNRMFVFYSTSLEFPFYKHKVDMEVLSTFKPLN